MAEKERRGGARPGAGRKPIPPDDVARIRRMLEVQSQRAIAKILGYSKGTVGNYAKQFEAEDDED